tara:strand:+ start:566 stop:2863 length:2298 start_codon:yes stop_codon:yes gene_type:complete
MTTNYCFDVINPNNVEINKDRLKSFIIKLYIGNEEPKFTSDKIPFHIVDAIETDGHICIRLGTAKKNNKRIQDINKLLTNTQLNRFGNGVKLTKPYLFEETVAEWWLDNITSPTTKKWNSIIQQGPYFTHLEEPYLSLNSSLIYSGKKYKLTPREEKIALFYASRKSGENKGTVNDKFTEDPIFNTNFFKDFKEYLTPEHKLIFTDFSRIVWTDIVSKYDIRKEEGLSDTEKLRKKEYNAAKERKYGYAILDGKKEKIANYTVEPQGIFFGRGNHPERGRIKRQINPEDVILNLGKKDPIPKAPLGHTWKGTISENNSTWLAKYNDSITGGTKYVLFNAKSKFKGQADLKKYETARKLEKNIDEVREKYMSDVVSSNLVKAQLGTVLWLIDHHGVRIGGKKDNDEADTVGATTLRVEHVKLKYPNIIIFDFLGKDSIQFYKEIKVPEVIFENFKNFKLDKSSSEEIFNRITSKSVNDYLKELDQSFSAKVFRTRLASSIMYNALKTIVVPPESTKTEIDLLFKKANAEVAKILNHTRSVSLKQKESIQKDIDKIKELEKEIKKLKKEGKSTKSKENQIQTRKISIEKKNDVMNVAVGTSLTNYIDPRIIVAWMKTFEIEPSYIYSKTLLTKFQWAIQTTKSKWDWETSPIQLIGDTLEPGKEEHSDIKLPPKKTTKSLPTKKTTKQLPPKKNPLSQGGGSIQDYKNLFILCENPKNIKLLKDISKQALDWIYPFSKYALKTPKGSTKVINHIITTFYEYYYLATT